MGIINILEGSFPKQSATIHDKSFMLPKAMMTIKTDKKETKFYNLRAALKSVDTIIDGQKPTVKIELHDGRTIIGKVDEKGFSTLKVALAMGTDGEDMIVTPANKKASGTEKPSIWTEQYKVPTPIAVALIGLMIVFIYMASGDSSPPSSQANRTVHENSLKAIAQTLCKDAVKNSLRSPSTADFPWAGDNISIENDQTRMTYTSYVDAQNGFGATVRTHFSCALEHKEGDLNETDNWNIKKLTTY